MGKESAARKYFVKANPLRPGQPEKRPYLDIFTKDSDNPVFHGKDITVNHVWLAFKCEQFARERPEERADFALLLSEETIAITADGCEHGNSAYKWVQAGRVSLSDENAWMIVYIIINTRMLALYKEAEGAERVVGGFRRCWGWPPAAAMAEEAYAELEAEPDTEVAALHANLVNNLAGLMPVDAPTDAAGPAARVGDKRPRTEEPEEVE
jgi:hypothetical protein